MYGSQVANAIMWGFGATLSAGLAKCRGGGGEGVVAALRAKKNKTKTSNHRMRMKKKKKVLGAWRCQGLEEPPALDRVHVDNCAGAGAGAGWRRGSA